MIVQYIKVLTGLWAFACFNSSRGKKEGVKRKENACHCSDGSLGVCICCVIGRKSTASLRPQISTDDDTRRAWHTFIGVRTQSTSKAAAGNLSSAGPHLVDLVRPLMTFSHFRGLGGLLLLFASFVTLRFARLWLSSQWPILHHRWGRQKGETTAHLLFGETRSVQLSERMERERQC